MATKTATPSETPVILRLFRDVDKLSKDAGVPKPASSDPVESTQAMLIKQMADDLKLKRARKSQ